jgi:hypothetical protein
VQQEGSVRQPIPGSSPEKKDVGRPSGKTFPGRSNQIINNGGQRHGGQRGEHGVGGAARASEAGIYERHADRSQRDQKNQDAADRNRRSVGADGKCHSLDSLGLRKALQMNPSPAPWMQTPARAKTQRDAF